jgi:hypothetical protein
MSASSHRLTYVLSGERGAMAFAPRLQPLAEVVCGAPWRTIEASVSEIVQAAKKLSAVFGADALMFHEQPQSDGKTTEEAVARLSADAAAAPSIIVLPGPVAQAERAGWDEGRSVLAAKDALVSRAEAYCAARAKLIILDEHGASPSALSSSAAKRLYTTLRNVTGYYALPLGIVADAEALGAASALKLDVGLVEAGAPFSSRFVDILNDADSAWPTLGLSLASFEVGVAGAWLRARQRAAEDRGLLITTSPRCDEHATVEAMHALRDFVHGAETSQRDEKHAV